jgi:hypothetical protein
VTSLTVVRAGVRRDRKHIAAPEATPSPVQAPLQHGG